MDGHHSAICSVQNNISNKCDLLYVQFLNYAEHCMFFCDCVCFCNYEDTDKTDNKKPSCQQRKPTVLPLSQGQCPTFSHERKQLP